jgi:hypothetical protein
MQQKISTKRSRKRSETIEMVKDMAACALGLLSLFGFIFFILMVAPC